MEKEDEWDDDFEVAAPIEVPQKGYPNLKERLGEYQKADCFGQTDDFFAESKDPMWSRPSLREAGKNNGKMMMSNKMFEMAHSTVQETSLAYQLVQRFITDAEGDVFFCKAKIAVSKNTGTTRGVLDRIKGVLDGSARLSMPFDDRCAVIDGVHHGEKVLMWITFTPHAEVYQLSVDVTSSPEAAEKVKAAIDREFDQERMASIKWWVVGRHGEEGKEFFLPPVKTILKPEFYPDLGDPSKYMSDYMASDEAVLLLAGPPGTGKTTLLRHLISDYKLRAYVIYDEAIMARDSVFQSFLFEEEADVMIIEDADTILSSREKDGNKLMARFLNVSDGLIKLPNKKLVFTTNITDFGNVDPALLRPGRCFGVMHTRLLNLSEAQAAARAAGVPIPIEKREYTVAELFNQGQRQEARQIGFGVRH